jgi:hypothetical protein
VKSVKNSLLDLHCMETAKINKQEEQKEIQKSFKNTTNFEQNKPQISPEPHNFLITDDMESTIIPKELSLNSKKFIEIKTKEVIYLTPDGKIYTEDQHGKLEILENIISLAPKPVQMNNSIHIQKNSLSESKSTPMIATMERTFPRHENLNFNEPMLPFPNLGGQSPFNFPSPSMHCEKRRMDEISLMTDPSRQYGFIYGFTPTHHNNFRQIDRRSLAHGLNCLPINNDRGEDNIRFNNFE